MTTMTRVALTATLLMAMDGAHAHHSFAMFDMTRSARLHGTVKAVEWTNPHVWVWVVDDAPARQRTTFGFETASPGELERFFGWSRSVLQVGDKVTVEYAPLRSGRSGGDVRRITLPSGRVLEAPAGRAGAVGTGRAPVPAARPAGRVSDAAQ